MICFETNLCRGSQSYATVEIFQTQNSFYMHNNKDEIFLYRMSQNYNTMGTFALMIEWKL